MTVGETTFKLFEATASQEIDMEAKRERRIRDKLRMKAKCKRVRPHDVNAVNADHMAECSCWMCGNPRRYFGLKTLQERRAEDLPTP